MRIKMNKLNLIITTLCLLNLTSCWEPKSESDTEDLTEKVQEVSSEIEDSTNEAAEAIEESTSAANETVEAATEMTEETVEAIEDNTPTNNESDTAGEVIDDSADSMENKVESKMVPEGEEISEEDIEE